MITLLIVLLNTMAVSTYAGLYTYTRDMRGKKEMFPAFSIAYIRTQSAQQNTINHIVGLHIKMNNYFKLFT